MSRLSEKFLQIIDDDKVNVSSLSKTLGQAIIDGDLSGSTPDFASAYLDLASGSPSPFSVTSTSYADFGTQSVTGVQTRFSAGSIGIGGGGANSLPEISISGLVVGKWYRVQVSFPGYGSVSDAQGYRLVRGSDVLGETSQASNSGTIYSQVLFGYFQATATSDTVKIQGKSNSGSVFIGSIGAGGGNTMEWDVKKA